MARLQDGSAGDDAPLARRGLALAALLLFACAQPSTEEPVKAKQEAPPPEEAPAPDPGGPPGPPLRADGTIFAGAEQMGTRVTIKVWVGDHSTRAAEIAIREAFAEIERIEEIASEWRPQSELSQFNAHAGREPIDMSADLFALLQRSKEIAAASGGTFDPTFHGVGQLWSFEPGAQPPPREAIAEKLKLVNWRAIELDPETHRGRLTNPGMKIGLGAIAKGYAVDRASELLRRRGFVHHIVEGGGDTYVS
ncbi:MAG: FAD:protein FMN transferase, partial [Myxococcales bacterium]|nr:FAD:protein FMN transferase [Myxococcales bacterium]